jgi:hypothetical protein
MYLISLSDCCGPQGRGFSADLKSVRDALTLVPFAARPERRFSPAIALSAISSGRLVPGNHAFRGHRRSASSRASRTT